MLTDVVIVEADVHARRHAEQSARAPAGVPLIKSRPSAGAHT